MRAVPTARPRKSASCLLPRTWWRSLGPALVRVGDDADLFVANVGNDPVTERLDPMAMQHGLVVPVLHTRPRGRIAEDVPDSVLEPFNQFIAEPGTLLVVVRDRVEILRAGLGMVIRDEGNFRRAASIARA